MQSQQTPDLHFLCSELCDFISTNILAPDVPVNGETVLSHIGVDSFSVIEIILFIERRFGVIIPDEALLPENLKSVKAIAACTLQYMNRQ